MTKTSIENKKNCHNTVRCCSEKRMRVKEKREKGAENGF
jgi:hypothetical protein